VTAEQVQRKDYTVLCERFRVENDLLMRQMAELYRKGQDFVAATIDLYLMQHDVQPVLNPPDAFFSGQPVKAGVTGLA
jgi:hypothetical protein